MSEDFKILQNKWEDGKKSITSATSDFFDLYKRIKNKDRDNYHFYYGTITILSITLSAISLFFYYTASVQETLSSIGVGLMISGLLFRIFIGIISIYKAKRINILDNALKKQWKTLLNFINLEKQFIML